MRKYIPFLLALALLTGCARHPQATPTPAITPNSTPEAPSSAQPTPEATPDSPKAKLPPLPGKLVLGDEGQYQLDVYLHEEDTVETLNLNDYLCGVLAGEMRNDWPEEALKAQAIIARTFLFDFLNTHDASAYSAEAAISTDISESQAYDAAGVNDRIRAAVQNTQGMVAVHDGQYIKAWFHSSAGGQTALADEGLNFEDGTPPYIHSTTSDESLSGDEFKAWSATYDKARLIALLKQAGYDISDITSMEVIREGPSGRALTIQVNSSLDIHAADFRMALDPKVFRSTLLDEFSYSGGALTAAGRGFGHGVGMSQWGAYTMAENGVSAEEIIHHYFKDIDIVQVEDQKSATSTEE